MIEPGFLVRWLAMSHFRILSFIFLIAFCYHGRKKRKRPLQRRGSFERRNREKLPHGSGSMSSILEELKTNQDGGANARKQKIVTGGRPRKRPRRSSGLAIDRRHRCAEPDRCGDCPHREPPARKDGEFEHGVVGAQKKKRGAPDRGPRGLGGGPRAIEEKALLDPNFTLLEDLRQEESTPTNRDTRDEQPYCPVQHAALHGADASAKGRRRSISIMNGTTKATHVTRLTSRTLAPLAEGLACLLTTRRRPRRPNRRRQSRWYHLWSWKTFPWLCRSSRSSTTCPTGHDEGPHEFHEHDGACGDKLPPDQRSERNRPQEHQHRSQVFFRPRRGRRPLGGADRFVPLFPVGLKKNATKTTRESPVSVQYSILIFFSDGNKKKWRHVGYIHRVRGRPRLPVVRNFPRRWSTHPKDLRRLHRRDPRTSNVSC